MTDRVPNHPQDSEPRLGNKVAAAVGSAIDLIVSSPDSADLVGAYFDVDRSFAGETFDSLIGGEVASPNTITVDDLLAVTLLDVRVRPLAMRRILGEVHRETLARGLEAIGEDEDLWGADPEKLDVARRLWTELRSTRFPGIGPVTASKLLARKRPRLIPIIDRVVVTQLALPVTEQWDTLRIALSDAERRARIDALSCQAPKGTSTLRLLDVVVWMHGSRSRNARAARDRARVRSRLEPIGATDPREAEGEP